MELSKNNLYLIQDDDRPCYVVARGWMDAIEKWEWVMAQENEITPEEVESPNGIQLICEASELIL